jgi:hypothetical protein
MAWDRRHRLLDLVRAALGSAVTIGCCWLVASFLPLYDIAARGHDTRYLPVAYGVAWVGIAVSLGVVVMLSLEALRQRRPIGWTPLVAVPLLVGSWVAGFLVAIVVAG